LYVLTKVISGDQTGADQPSWRAARAFGIPSGGWMPAGFLTEDGPRPDFAELYGAVEMSTPDHHARTEQNVRDSDAMLWFGDPNTPGGKVTIRACDRMGRPSLLVIPGRSIRPSQVADWLRAHPIQVLNVAGNRESKAPGIGERVERFIAEVFRQLGHRPD
jgi:hypothetical protein